MHACTREREVITLWDGCKDPEEQCHGEHGGYTLPACHFLSTSLSLLCLEGWLVS